MNWGLIPEAFYDVLARLVPGSLFLIAASAVHFGPGAVAELLVDLLPSANLASLLLFGLLAYFAAIVLKVIWDSGNAVGDFVSQMGTTPEGPDEAPSNTVRPFSEIRLQMPTEVARLLKLQAEKNICEVLIPGLGIVLVWDAWLAASLPTEDRADRIALGILLLVCWLAFWFWRSRLEDIFLDELEVLEEIGHGGQGP